MMGSQRRCHYLLLPKQPSWAVSYTTLVVCVVLMMVQSQRHYAVAEAAAVGFVESSSRINVAFVAPRKNLHDAESSSTITIENSNHHLLNIRGGSSKAKATVGEDEEEESKDAEEETDNEEEEGAEEEEEFDASLAAATVKASTKTKIKDESNKAKATKSAVNAKLTQEASASASAAIKIQTSPKKKKSNKTGGILAMLHVPYILRACLNPFIFFSMTKAYWASLFSLDYPPKEQTQDLRSALEDKARKGGGKSRGTRKMKRGQAKTISDLPKLNT